MRLLLPGDSGLTPHSDLDLGGLATVYAARRDPWLRCNMVTTLDGGANGPDGRSGTINTDADHVVFDLLRGLSDAVVVGAGTVRTERYSTLTVAPEVRGIRERAGLAEALPLVAVTRSGAVPPTLRGAVDGAALLVTCAASPGLTDAQTTLGTEHVLVCGDDEVDLGVLVERLHERGWTRLLCEGGPHLTASFLGAGLVDELCFTVAPRIVGGRHPRPVGPDAAPIDLELGGLVEEDGTLMGRWFTSAETHGGADAS
jgi:riboflavin biosynthesis pyrimidine reductase